MNLSQVYSLQLEPTSYCNAKCTHCARFDDNGYLNQALKLTNWDWNTVKSNLELDKLVNLRGVLLQGDKGDPLMHPNIGTMIRDFCAGPSSPSVTVNTNGGLRNESWFYELGDLKNLKFTFSIDGLDDTNHLYRRNVDFKKVIANAKSFIKSGGHAIWHCLIFKHNQHQVEEIKKFALDIGFKDVFFDSCDVSRFKGQQQWPVKDKGQLVGYISPPDIPEDEIRSLNSFYIVSNNKNFQNTNFACPNLRRGNVYVTSQCDVFPCCMMHFEQELVESVIFSNHDADRLVHDFIGIRKHNNLNNSKLSAILNNSFFGNNLEQSFKDNTLLELCETCCGDQIRKNL